MKITLYPYKSAVKIGREVFSTEFNDTCGLPDYVFGRTYEAILFVNNNINAISQSCFVIIKGVCWQVPGVFVSHIKY